MQVSLRDCKKEKKKLLSSLSREKIFDNNFLFKIRQSGNKLKKPNYAQCKAFRQKSLLISTVNNIKENYKKYI